jgi:ADP-dependent phosphofructokinase/glucokinase
MTEEKIALGFSGNVDYELEWDSAVLEDLIKRFGIKAAEIDASVPVSDMRSLVISILGFMRAGTGGEIFARNLKTVEEFSRFFKYKVTIGGTNTRAAIAIGKIGFKARLHTIAQNDHTRRLLPPDDPVICSDEGSGFYPHIVVQYIKGTEIKAGDIHLIAERPNRIIYVNNPQKLDMKINPRFFDHMENIQVLLVSGFNSMHDKDLLVCRMKQLTELLDTLPQGVKVVSEDGCYHYDELNPIVTKALCKYLTVFGLNEDELSRYIGKNPDLLNAETVYSFLPELKEKIPVPVLVIHTKYWALAYGENAEKYRPSLKSGICLATTRLRYGDDIDRERYRETGALDRDAQGAAFSAAIQRLGKNTVCCEAALDVKEAKLTTIGLGDAFVGGFLSAMIP